MVIVWNEAEFGNTYLVDRGVVIVFGLSGVSTGLTFKMVISVELELKKYPASIFVIKLI